MSPDEIKEEAKDTCNKPTSCVKGEKGTRVGIRSFRIPILNLLNIQAFNTSNIELGGRIF